MSTVDIVGDISIAPRTRPPHGLDLRSGADGRTRIVVPEADRLALAQAIAGEGYRVVAVSEMPPGIGAVDVHGVPLRIGDTVRFRYTVHEDEGPGISSHEGIGELRMSPYAGAYVVYRGLCYPLRRSRWVEIVRGESNQ